MNSKLDWVITYNKANNDEYKNFVLTGKYLAIYRPNHPKSRVDGYVYIHQLQAEKKIGRQLNDDECVHHIDENKYNNDLNNLMVFKTKADHTAFHGGAEIYLDGDVWVAKYNENYICPMCGNEKDCHAKMCRNCYLKYHSLHIPKKEELLNLITTTSFLQIGKMYGVSDNAVRKWCKKYDLPFKYKDIKLLKQSLGQI